MTNLASKLDWALKSEPNSIQQITTPPPIVNAIDPAAKTNLPQRFMVGVNMEGKEIYIYMLIKYNDALIHGKLFYDEFWIKWQAGNRKASHMTSQDKLALDPYVKYLYKEEKNTCKLP